MKKTICIAVLLSLAFALPSFARGGGRGGGGGGGGFGGGAGGGGQGGGGGGGFGGQGAGGGGFGGQGGGRTQGTYTTNPGGFNGGYTTNSAQYDPYSGAGGRTTNPRGRGYTSALTEDFALLDTTSIFSQNRQAAAADGMYAGSTPATRPVVIQTAAPVFRGVVNDDKGLQAVLEVTTREGNAMLYVRARDRLDWDGSVVSSISMSPTLLTLTPQRGSERQIQLGYNVENQEIRTMSTAPSYQSLDLLSQQQLQQPQQRTNTRTQRGGRGGTQGGQGQYGPGGVQGGQGGYGPGGAQGGYAPGGFSGQGAVVQPGPTGNFTAGQATYTIGNQGGGTVMTLQSGTLVQPSLDPPLPPGSADSVEARMAQRRQAQIGN